MTKIRSGFDRRSNINRRHISIPVRTERRRAERRNTLERRGKWVRASKWSSVDHDQLNRYFWYLLNSN